MVRRPISRILFHCASHTMATAIYLDPKLLWASSDLPEGNSRASLVLNTLLFGLAPGDACHAVCVTTNAVSSYLAISPLPVIGNASPIHRRYIFCGAGVGSLRLGITQHPCPWSPDFPPPTIKTWRAAVQPPHRTSEDYAVDVVNFYHVSAYRARPSVKDHLSF